MLMYLDNFSSVADNPKSKGKKGLNENYARELMELHTLGVDGGYTQKDVTEAARVLTGWTIYPMQGYGNVQKENIANNKNNVTDDLYDNTVNEVLRDTGKESFEAMKMLQSDAVKNYEPANNVTYPGSSLGKSLKQIAQLIKMDVGLEVAFTESNGWDTHFNQGKEIPEFLRAMLLDLSNSNNGFLERYSKKYQG
ncbi:hypothetical protein FQR65_LT18009 [Abscondita terminalis]|nr:hypothetical protein FQR65_LT18009 [Abscondita terminalis]